MTADSDARKIQAVILFEREADNPPSILSSQAYPQAVVPHLPHGPLGGADNAELQTLAGYYGQSQLD